MNERQALLSAIAENLYDDTPRLVFADWLQEHGEEDLAEFIRVQCELEPIRDRYEIDRATELHSREEELLRKHQHAWLGPEMEGWDRWREDGASAEFRRGFVDTVKMPVPTFLALGAGIRRWQPTIRRVTLHRVSGYGDRLAECKALDGVAELELACWYTDADADAIASSPHLVHLQVLELWLGRRSPLRDSRLCRIMAGSDAWPNLRELTLLNPDDENVRGRKRLVSVANEAAGRGIAVYHRGWPELFPFAADYWYTFPGYLANGQTAMAIENARTSPQTFSIITFDKKGKQTDKVLTVAFPDDLAVIAASDWYNHKDRMQEHLIETIGFRPGFIRIRDCQFPGDEWSYNSPCWEVFSLQGEEESFGVPDREDDVDYGDDPCGYAGCFSRRLRNQEYVFGWDRYADKRGRVHST